MALQFNSSVLKPDVISWFQLWFYSNQRISQFEFAISKVVIKLKVWWFIMSYLLEFDIVLISVNMTKLVIYCTPFSESTMFTYCQQFAFKTAINTLRLWCGKCSYRQWLITFNLVLGGSSGLTIRKPLHSTLLWYVIIYC